jgi:pimeloyl-ACP methyl ester carboxylesterase
LVADDRSVVAVDLSGHGDSGDRVAYGLEAWAAEILAVAREAGIVGPPILVGHSLGGWSTVVATADHPEAVRALVLVDCRIIDPEGEERPPSKRPLNRARRVYATLDEALARYRPEPAQHGNLPFVVDHLAATSAREVEGGWTWKFDPAVLEQRRPGREALNRITCPVAILRGERGLMTPEVTREMVAALDGRANVVDIPLAGHHMMLDQPLSLVTALRAVLGGWSRAPT